MRLVLYAAMQQDMTTGEQGGTALALQAIAQERCIDATYNRMAVRLAPHILYTRHGELYLDAVTIRRDGQPPREEKIGSFKVSGLGTLQVTDQGFVRSALFDPTLDRYVGETLFAVAEPVAA